MSLAGNKKGNEIIIEMMSYCSYIDQLVILLPGLLVVYSTRSGKEVWKIPLPDKYVHDIIIII